MRIGDVAGRVGMSVSTLRAWERRYGVLRPERTVGGHRVYREEDVDRVRTIQARIAAGWTVAAAAETLTDRALTVSDVIDDVVVLRALAAARHHMLQAESPDAVVEALVGFVGELGGAAVPAPTEPDP